MCAAHEMGSWHPECPARLAAIQDQLIASGLAPLLEHIDAPPASLDAIMRAHAREYVQALQSRAPERGYLALDPDTTMNPSTWQAALHAAGAVVEATDRVMDGSLANSFCVVRPPGHHARPAAAMGFCLFNNVAVAAGHAVEALSVPRVAVLDFDGHHGNGTQEIFYRDGRVLSVSLHRSPFYPGTGAADETGEG